MLIARDRSKKYFIESRSKSTRTGTPMAEKLKDCDQGKLTYHGGNLMKGKVNLYNIYIGQHAADYSTGTTTPKIIESFSKGFNRSSYANILSDYYFNGMQTPTFTYMGDSYVGLSADLHEQSFSDDSISLAVDFAIRQKNWAYDPNGIYSIIFRGDFQ